MFETTFKVLDETIGNSNYSHADCANLNQSTVENITKRLVEQNRPFKYIGMLVYLNLLHSF